MKLFWSFCAGASIVGMVAGYSIHSPLLFAYNALTFLLDLWFILFKEEAQ